MVLAGATSSGSLSVRLISDSDTEMCPKSGVGLSKMAYFMLSSFWVRSDSSFCLLRLFAFCCSVFFLEGDEVLAEIIRMFYEGMHGTCILGNKSGTINQQGRVVRSWVKITQG